MKRCAKCRKQNKDTAAECEFCHHKEFLPSVASAARLDVEPEPEPAADDDFNDNSDGDEQQTDQKKLLEEIRFYSQEMQAGDRPRKVVLLGHSNSGKSWFIYRAKHQCDKFKCPVVDPPIYDLQTKQRSARGKRLGTTTRVELHLMRGEKKNAFVFIDIEGERYSRAVARQFRGSDEILLEAVAHADAYIFLAPATDTLFPQRAFDAGISDTPPDEARARMELLRGNVQNITRFVSFVERNRKAKISPQESVKQYVAMDEVERRRVLSAGAKSNRPAMFLMSKADAFQRLCQQPEFQRAEGGRHWEAMYDADPTGLLARTPTISRGLLKAFDIAFRRYRFDFVTAFDGHQELRAGVAGRDDIPEPDECGHYGVVEALKWLAREIDAPLNPGVTPAAWLRKRLDKGFREAL